jgi:hypothetical protein
MKSGLEMLNSNESSLELPAAGVDDRRSFVFVVDFLMMSFNHSGVLGWKNGCLILPVAETDTLDMHLVGVSLGDAYTQDQASDVPCGFGVWCHKAPRFFTI